MGLHGLCFGFCFAGPLPLRSLTNGPLFRVCFRESLVVRLYSEINHLHLSIDVQCVSHLLPLGDTYESFEFYKIEKQMEHITFVTHCTSRVPKASQRHPNDAYHVQKCCVGHSQSQYVKWTRRGVRYDRNRSF